MWAVIGARLGFTSFPGSESEPAKAGPGVAQQLQHMYKQYLLHFDNWYAAQYMEKKMAVMQQQHQQQQVQHMPLQSRLPLSPVQMQYFINLSQYSVAELTAKHIDEKQIAFVEQNRATLQRTSAEQKQFQLKVRNQANAAGGQGAPELGGAGGVGGGGGVGGAGGQQPGYRPPGANPFGGPAPTQDPAALATRQLYMQQQQQHQHQQQQQAQQQQMQQHQQQQVQQQQAAAAAAAQQGQAQPGQGPGQGLPGSSGGMQPAGQHMQPQPGGQMMGMRSMAEMAGFMGGRPPNQALQNAEMIIRKAKQDFMVRGELLRVYFVWWSTYLFCAFCLGRANE